MSIKGLHDACRSYVCEQFFCQDQIIDAGGFTDGVASYECGEMLDAKINALSNVELIQMLEEIGRSAVAAPTPASD